MQYAIILLLAILSGICYRLGGASPEDYPRVPEWLIKGVTRDIGCTICSILVALTLGLKAEWWQWLGFIAVGWWGLKSYWSWVNEIFKREYISRQVISDSIFRLYELSSEYKTKENEDKYLAQRKEIKRKIEYYSNKHWWNWLLVGLTMSYRWLFLVPAPWVFALATVNAIIICVWRDKIDFVDEEEFITGVLFII